MSTFKVSIRDKSFYVKSENSIEHIKSYFNNVFLDLKENCIVEELSIRDIDSVDELNIIVNLSKQIAALNEKILEGSIINKTIRYSDVSADSRDFILSLLKDLEDRKIKLNDAIKSNLSDRLIEKYPDIIKKIDINEVELIGENDFDINLMFYINGTLTDILTNEN